MMKKQNIIIISIVIFSGIILYNYQSSKVKNKKSIKVSYSYKNKAISNYKIQGIDVSHYQGTINWRKVKHPDNTKNIDFVFIRVSIGHTKFDKMEETG